ncbi:type II toxin-antitoxin system VapC family toxin [Novosphingobium sp. G106]|uniref:type II toxin-antitoxin system VapC family toxin n=1 Tax=Novosphingobium sp. G106 TaxID=2849500 RepID=UPI001C2D8AD8|nr:type II toxin-antitoxin system VapC family toxin [Novosphingobium sp. G106]MBV1689048.1 type II toxin-antitoxin system VapC family toxin [Novosphingobium sp. G106]
MRSLDTNVLARWVLGDDPAQARVAETLLAEPVWISHTVLIELGWVLHKARGLPRLIVADMVQQVIDLDTVLVERHDALIWAIGRYRQGADWGDVMHIVAGVGYSDAFATFDRKLARRTGGDAPLPVETLRS